MSGTIEPFGTMPDGTAVERVKIAAGGLTAHFITYGAVLQDLRLAGHGPALVLGFDNLPDYLKHSRHLGATAGPCANRIARGHAVVDGRTVQLDTNEGRNHLHGGRLGTGHLVWRLDEAKADAVTFSLTLPDGHMGYPGPMRLKASFRLMPPATLEVVYEAESDAPSLANLAHHTYFNLSGAPTILDHALTIFADTMLPVDEEKIPTGPPVPVEGTDLDFRAPRAIGATPSGGPSRLDRNFCPFHDRGPMRHLAHVEAPTTGITLDVHSTEPGIQAYDAYMLDVPVPGLDGMTMGAHAGFCLETQVWPDAVNHPDYFPALLEPGTPTVQTTHYVFGRG